MLCLVGSCYRQAHVTFLLAMHARCTPDPPHSPRFGPFVSTDSRGCSKAEAPRPAGAPDAGLEHLACHEWSMRMGQRRASSRRATTPFGMETCCAAVIACGSGRSLFVDQAPGLAMLSASGLRLRLRALCALGSTRHRDTVHGLGRVRPNFAAPRSDTPAADSCSLSTLKWRTVAGCYQVLHARVA